MLSCLILLLMVKDVFSRDNQSSHKMEHRFRRELIIADGLKSAVDLVMSRMKTLKEEAALEMENHADDMQTILRNFQEVADAQFCSPNRAEQVFSQICDCVEHKPHFPDYNDETFSLGQNRFREWSQNYDSLSSDVNKTRDHIKLMQVEYKKSEKVCRNIVDPVRREECTWEINKRANKTFEDINSVQDKASKIILQVKEVLERFVDEIFQHKTLQINDATVKIESYVCCLDRAGLRVQNYECEKGNNSQFFIHNRTIAEELEKMKIFLKHDYNSTRILLENIHKSEDSDDVNDKFDIEARKKFAESVSDLHVPRQRKKYYGIDLKRGNSWIRKDSIRSLFTDEQNDELLQATNVKKRHTEFIDKPSENIADNTTEVPSSGPLNMDKVNTDNTNNDAKDVSLQKPVINESNKLKNTDLKEMTTIKIENEVTTLSPQFKTIGEHLEQKNSSNNQNNVPSSQEDKKSVKLNNLSQKRPNKVVDTSTLKFSECSSLKPELNVNKSLEKYDLSNDNERENRIKANIVTTLESTSSLLATETTILPMTETTVLPISEITTFSTTEVTELETTNTMENLLAQSNVPSDDNKFSHTTCKPVEFVNCSTNMTKSYETEVPTSTLEDLIMSTLYPHLHYNTGETVEPKSKEDSEFKSTSVNVTTNQPTTEYLQSSASTSNPTETL